MYVMFVTSSWQE